MKRHKKISKLKKNLILWDFLQKYNNDALLVNTGKFMRVGLWDKFLLNQTDITGYCIIWEYIWLLNYQNLLKDMLRFFRNVTILY